MNRSIHRLVLLAACGAALFAAGTGIAKDGETHEVREARESREREPRDARPEREDRSGKQASDRSVSNSGSGDSGKDRNEGNRGENRGRDSDARAARIEVERVRGGDRQRDEVLLIGPDDSIPAVRRAGFTLLSERRMQSLRQTMVRVRVRDGQTVEQLMELLRQLVPGAHVAPNHVYNPSQRSATSTASSMQRQTDGQSAALPTPAMEIGIIDTGADPDNARLRSLLRATQGFAPGGYRARAHGTAVAELAATQAASMAVADVFGLDRRNQLVAPAELIAAALDWMISQRVRVVNISIEGPYNAVLEFVVQDAIARGMAVVAAAGNGGPSAAPAYPAAYAGVIAVTALDERGQLYRRAARGEYVQFAARGSYATDQSLVATRIALAGTSFAAPVVAAEIARRWRSRPDVDREAILAMLRADAVDMGAPGRDPVYGWGRIAIAPQGSRGQ